MRSSTGTWTAKASRWERCTCPSSFLATAAEGHIGLPAIGFEVILQDLWRGNTRPGKQVENAVTVTILDPPCLLPWPIHPHLNSVRLGPLGLQNHKWQVFVPCKAPQAFSGWSEAVLCLERETLAIVPPLAMLKIKANLQWYKKSKESVLVAVIGAKFWIFFEPLAPIFFKVKVFKVFRVFSAFWSAFELRITNQIIPFFRLKRTSMWLTWKAMFRNSQVAQGKKSHHKDIPLLPAVHWRSRPRWPKGRNMSRCPEMQILTK